MCGWVGGGHSLYTGAPKHSFPPSTQPPPLSPSPSLPAGYTHTLKVDDDVYLRIGQVLEALLHTPTATATGDGHNATTASGAPAVQGWAPTRRLPATHQQLVETMERGGGPLHTDGIQASGRARGWVHGCGRG